MYKVLARKWRPRVFDELVGQKHVSRALGNAISGGRVAHAYIFAGLRGTGKTTVARILAKCLNCEKGPTTAPCGTCAPCQEIAESRAMDVLEIDAASRTKVEQTRELLEMVTYAPVRDRTKILIIDEAHMLSKASFNALLKTLEEPPPNVVFILATTEIQKVLPTILSRCQVFEFRRVTTREVADHLRTMCDAEKIEISDRALERLARAGEGSVRDSISALERVLAFCGDEVSDGDVLRMLGAVRAEVLDEIVAGMAARDAGRMLTVLDSLVDEGHDLVHFWNELVSATRDLLLLDTLPDRRELLVRSPDEAESLAAAAVGLSREDLVRIFQLLSDLEFGLKSSSHPQFLFEAALIRMASLAAVRPIEEFLATMGGRPSSGLPTEPTRPTPPKKKAVKTDDVVSRIQSTRPMLGAVLEQAASIELSGGALRIRFARGMEALKRTVEAPESLELLRTVAGDGKPLEIRVEIDVTAEAPRAPDPERRTRSSASTGKPVTESLLERIRREPGVEKLLDVFGAQVVDVGPLDAPTPERPDESATGGSLEER
jgi:DNA polymerase-3 subunit gamma/tau